jgi:serine/threonine protein kinase
MACISSISNDMAENAQSSSDTTLGKLVVEHGLVTAEEVQQCLEQQRGSIDDSGSGINQQSLGKLLVVNGMATRKQIDRLTPAIEERRASRQIPGYQMLEKLGAGAMATVYKAKQLSLDRMVAIKVLPRKHTNNPQFVERFYAEGKAAAKLNHPNIVGALDVGKSGQTHYFVMEYVEGSTVYEQLTEKGPYSEERALQIGLQVANALNHAHEAGFIHRDVKPKNIMIATDGVAKLADMGLARAISDREAAEAEAGKAFGTPYYISPEQIRGVVDVDSRADIYSLGATMYHMVTGKVPFEGPNPSAVMHKHLKTDLIPPDHVNQSLTSGISEIIEVCLAKNVRERYASAAELIEDLEEVSQGEPPPQARKLFDLSALSSLDRDAEHPTELIAMPQNELLASNPLFWLALGGWLMVLILLLILVFMAE